MCLKITLTDFNSQNGKLHVWSWGEHNKWEMNHMSPDFSWDYFMSLDQMITKIRPWVNTVILQVYDLDL